MKRFRFRFEAVLKQRAIVEDLRLQEFVRVQGELAACEARIAALAAEFSRGMAERPVHIDVEDFPRRERYLDTVKARIEQEERVREGIAARLEDARRELVIARQASEAMERVREEDLAAYKVEMARVEQNALDEIATQRVRRPALGV